jgi:hypothetical protein
MCNSEVEFDRCEHCGYTVRILQDSDPPNPRLYWDNLGRMVCWHSRYNLGDIRGKERYPSAEDGTQFPEPSDFSNWWKLRGYDKRGGLLLPLYLYDHSGITMSTGPYSCPWDSGQVGWIYCTPGKLRKEYGRGWRNKLNTARKCLESEVAVYATYLEGGFCGYIVEDADGLEIESCWGIDDSDYAMAEGKRIAEYAANQLNYSI